LNKMLTHLNGYKREAVLAPLFKMLEATFDLFVPLVMADIVNVGITAHDFPLYPCAVRICCCWPLWALPAALTAHVVSSATEGGGRTSSSFVTLRRYVRSSSRTTEVVVTYRTYRTYRYTTTTDLPTDLRTVEPYVTVRTGLN